MEITTDKVLEKYNLTRYNLNLLIENNREFIGYIDSVIAWNGQSYIKKHIYEEKDLTVEQVKSRIEEIKTKIKADKKANKKDIDIIDARKRTLKKHNRNQIKSIIEQNYCSDKYEQQNTYGVDKTINENIDKIKDKIGFKIDKSNCTVKILKSDIIEIEIVVFIDEWEQRIDDYIPIYYLEVGDKIEWEKIRSEGLSKVTLIVYKYLEKEEIVGYSYKIISFKNECKTKVIDRFTTVKY